MASNLDEALGENPLAGTTGTLTVATRGDDGPGEVVVRTRGGSAAYIAWSATPLPRGASVLITGERGGRAVDVSA